MGTPVPRGQCTPVGQVTPTPSFRQIPAANQGGPAHRQVSSCAAPANRGSPLRRPAASSATDTLPILPGDVLFVRGNGGIAEIGTTGGFMGHVVVVLAAPERLACTSHEALELLKGWPSMDTSRVWCLETVESARGHSGLCRCTLLLYVEPRSKEFVLVGELPHNNHSLALIDKERVELWQSPPELRAQLRVEDMAVVLAEMIEVEQSWSLTTAARALLKTAAVSRSKSLRKGTNRAQLLQELQDCWDQAPICTSVVVVFWQQYLCMHALATGQQELDLILRWMPLKADRGLPGDLVTAMRRSGWVAMKCLP